MQDEVLNKMKKTTSANVDNQAEQPVEQPTGAENNIYSAENNQAYYDATKPVKQTNYAESVAKNQNEETAKMNTGTGASAAVGTDYSWDTKGKKLAENAYQQKALEEKQNMLTQRQDMEKNAQQYQTQADMQKYTDNQTADKVGWTGGYVLDQERQREYMKQSIQAQLYGAMELQKYGYDTAMAAARLSYDANLLTYAQEYYNQAVQNSLNEAQLTGTYFSAEVKDMLGQYTIAEANLNDNSLSDEERTRAQKVKDTIDNWFNENNISRAGIKTLEAWNAEQSLELQWTNELWTQYNAAMESAKTSLTENVDEFIMLDDNGNPIYDGTTVKTNNWETISGQEILDNYLTNDASGKRRQQFFSYLDRQLAGESAANFENWLKAEGYMNDKGTVDGDYKDLYGEFLGKSDTFATFLTKKFSKLNEEDREKLAEALNGYDLTINLPNGETVTYTLNVTDEGFSNGKDANQQNSSGDSSLILDTTYTDKTKNIMLNKLFDKDNNGNFTNEKFATLSSLLDAVESDTRQNDWNETNGAWNTLAGLTLGVADIIEGVASGKPTEQKKAIDEVLSTINKEIGTENLELLKDMADEWDNMSERDRALLTDTQISYYQEATNFAIKIARLQEARDYITRHDSVIWEWDAIPDTWRAVGNRWKKMDSFGDFVGAVGSTLGGVATTVISGVGGFFKNLFTWSW